MFLFHELLNRLRRGGVDKVGLLVLALALATVSCGNDAPVEKTNVELVGSERNEAPAESLPPEDKKASVSVEVVVDEQYLDAVLKIIGEAKNEIDIVHFEYAWGSAIRKIQSALIEAMDRGVQVRMLFDDGPKVTARSIPFLEKKGFDVQLDDSRTKLHLKMVLVDQETVLFGSTNLSNMSIERNHETNLLVTSKDLGKACKSYADEVRMNPDESVDLPLVQLEGVTVYFDREFEEALMETLKNAQKRILVQMYGTKLYADKPKSPSTRAFNLLREAKKSGLEVRVILEQGSGDWGKITNELNDKTAAYLREAGVEVRFDSPDIFSHAKLVIADDVATIGSMNWGYGGFRLYHEINAVVTRPDAVADLEEYYEMLWSESETRKTKG